MAKASCKNGDVDGQTAPSSVLDLCAPKTQLLARPDAGQTLHGQKHPTYTENAPTQRHRKKKD